MEKLKSHKKKCPQRQVALNSRGMEGDDSLSTTLRYVLGLLESNKPQGGYHMYCICMGEMAFCCILQSPNPEKTTKTNGQVK